VPYAEIVRIIGDDGGSGPRTAHGSTEQNARSGETGAVGAMVVSTARSVLEAYLKSGQVSSHGTEHEPPR
jgi:hypothetical protein